MAYCFSINCIQQAVYSKVRSVVNQVACSFWGGICPLSGTLTNQLNSGKFAR